MRFGEVIAALAEQGHRVFVEVSPHPVLGMAIAQAGQDLAVTASLHRGDGGRSRWLRALAGAYAAGAGVDWAAVTADGGRARKVALPTYPFQRQRYWPKAAAGRGHDGGPAGSRFWQAIERNDVGALAGVLGPTAERSVVESLMPALSDLRRRQRSHAKFSSQLYRVAWEPVTAEIRPAVSGSWLVLVPPGFPDEGVAAEVAEALSADRWRSPSSSDRSVAGQRLDWRALS